MRLLCLAALLLLGLLPPPAEAGIPDGVFRGDAVAQAPGPNGSVRYFALRTADDAQPAQHRAWELGPGASRTLNFRTWTTGIAPPGLPTGDTATDDCRLSIYYGTGSVLQRTLYAQDTCPPDGAAFTLYGTTNGNAGANAIAGTLRLRVAVRDALPAGGDLYNVDTDAAGQGYPGALRSGLHLAQLTPSTYPAGSTFASTGPGESLVYTITGTTEAIGQLTTGELTFRLRAPGTTLTAPAGYTASGNTGTGTASFLVGDAFPAAPTAFTPELEITGTSLLTGLPWTHLHSTAAPLVRQSAYVATSPATVNVDPRLFVVHLFQVDDPAFGTPPLGKNQAPERSPMEVGFHAARILNARGEPLIGSAIATTTTLQDARHVVPIITATCPSACLDTHGGEPGWTELAAWTNGGPVGAWNKTLDLTAPAHLDADGLLVGSNTTLTITRLEPGGGDPLKLTVSPLRAEPGQNVSFALVESYLNGTARTGNANATWLRVYGPTGAIVQADTSPLEVGYGAYLLNYTAPHALGVYYVLARTLDPDTGLDVATANVFEVRQPVALAASVADLNTSLDAHRELSPEYTAAELEDANRGLLADVAWLLWIAFVVLTRLVPQRPLRLAVNLAGYAVLAFDLSAFWFLTIAVLHSCVVLYDFIAVLTDKR